MKFRSILLVLPILLLSSCFEDQDDNAAAASEINDFVWKGMNAVYLYKANIPNLADDRFSSDEEYANYLNSFDTPEQLFESLIYMRQTVDKYSWIVDDYIALEQQFSGVTKNNGMDFGLRYIPGSSNNVFGYARLVLPNSDAEAKGLQRGDIFTHVDGVQLTDENFGSLLFGSDSYTIDLADYDTNGTPQDNDDTLTPNGTSVSLTKFEYTENPVFISETLNVDGEMIGYLMYNGFVSDFNNQLNNAFADFAANNVQHLVLDLRYNPGGSVNTASLLGSMITGQFTGQVFTKLNYNEDLQEFNTDFNFVNAINGGTSINSLGLDKVYIIATASSASASEMVINSLEPYIDVIHIGENTEGKSQASITIYDSPDLGRDGANPSHTYAMQPLVAISVNRDDGLVPSTGLVPDIALGEDVSNLGVLGDESEPLLALAINEITVTHAPFNLIEPVKLVGDSSDEFRFAKEMIIDEPPAGIIINKLNNKQ